MEVHGRSDSGDRGYIPIRVDAGGRIINIPVRATKYDSWGAASGIVTNKDLKADTALFDNITTAYFVAIRTDGEVTVRFNSTSNDLITISANTTLTNDTLNITNIYLTASASANVKIYIDGV